MADGTLRLTVDIEPRHSQAAFALFGAPGTPMALAAIKCATAEPAEKPKGGKLARDVAMMCANPAFHRWAQEHFTREWGDAPGDTPTAWAASVVRAVCGIESRAELDSDEAAAKRFHALIRRPFEAA
jgi:hypothetical protein